jgi:hypothetical protein
LEFISDRVAFLGAEIGGRAFIGERLELTAPNLIGFGSAKSLTESKEVPLLEDFADALLELFSSAISLAPEVREA